MSEDALSEQVALQKLLDERQEQQEQLEEKISRLRRELNETPAGVDGALIDAEGFPRDDCDLHAVRQMRHDLACAITDLRSVGEERTALVNALVGGDAPITSPVVEPPTPAGASPPLNADGTAQDEVDIIRAAAAEARARLAAQVAASEAALAARTAEVSAEPTKEAVPSPSARDDARYLDLVRSFEPYASVTAVAPNSPASEAGFSVGDRVVAFNFITPSFPNPFQMTVDMIPRNVGRVLRVVVDRDGDRIVLRVTPGEWGGGGVLGAALAPVEA